MPYLTWLADACRDTGYPVVEVPGWRVEGHGPMTAAHGVVGHWTAGPAPASRYGNKPSLDVVINGRPGLDGPLCNVYTAFDGTLYVVAAGKAYHAGVSGWLGETDLNDTFVGNEVESPGGFAYTDAQLDVTPRLHAALLRRMKRTANWSCAHFECALPPGRKPDGPARDMDAFRRTVAAYLADPTLIKVIRKQEDVSIVDAETKKYLDGKFAQLNQAFSTVIYGDQRVDTLPDTHPFNLQALDGKLDELAARLDALEAPAEPPAQA